MQARPLIPVGSTIKVDKSKIKDFLPRKILENLPQIIKGEVIDYKMTDGMSIGYVLMTEKKLKIWIFKNELNEESKSQYQIYEPNSMANQNNNEFFVEKYKIDYELNGNRTIKAITNPFNLIKWLIYTLKDII